MISRQQWVGELVIGELNVLTECVPSDWQGGSKALPSISHPQLPGDTQRRGARRAGRWREEGDEKRRRRPRDGPREHPVLSRQSTNHRVRPSDR